jgi:hypothetical protein
MKLENQCCTRQQAERLKELGVDGQSLFCFCQVNPGGHNHEDSYSDILPTIFDLAIPDLATTFEFPAWTVAELGVMLGRKTNSIYIDAAGTWGIQEMGQFFEAKESEASARAEYLIYLLEQEMLTPTAVNARLEKEGRV